MGAAATSKRTRQVEIEGQEASWASRRQWEPSSAIGSAESTVKAADTMVDGGEWTAQQAQHAATWNESKRTC